MTYTLTRLACAAILLAATTFAAGAQTRAGDGASPVVGLWSYETLTPAKGPSVALNGYFVFLDGYFIQEALNQGEPFDSQLVQAHAGRYTIDAAGEVRLVTDVQLAIRPRRVPPVISNPGRTHAITPRRGNDRLRLTFGSGTVQTFRRAGPGAGRMVLLETGALALVDGRFILVADHGGVQVVGAGRLELSGSRLGFIAERWAVAREGNVTYQRDARIDAQLTNAELRVPGLPPFPVRSGNQQAGRSGRQEVSRETWRARESGSEG